MIKAVIFDLDDTLISEKEYVESGYHHIAKIIGNSLSINYTQVYDDLIRLFKASPINVFNRFYEEYRFDYSKETILDLVKEYREHLPNIHFYDDVLPCLSELEKLGLKVGIITDGYSVVQRQKLRALQADRYFDEIVVTDELGIEYWKPHPLSFEIIKERFNIEFEKMIYVGDNPEKDFYISELYPIRTVRIQRYELYNNKPYLNNTKESVLIHNLDEIKNCLNKL